MSRYLNRRDFLVRGTAAALAASGLPSLLAAQGAPALVVYKSPDCGCCALWADHVKAAGFAVSVRNSSDVASVKKRYGVPGELYSCHTAVVGGYVIEGHVPADVISRLLKEKPRVKGLAVPGMPSGSPGMEGPREPYQVLTFDAAGKTTVFARR
ncbi:MAG TPA: DUF411 domain-containing protein [Gemmatimonadales bacterium]|nr:DUF411 domain-containing protein [Gemmatimonadales bacterium]